MSFSTAALGRRALPIVVLQCETLSQKEKLRDGLLRTGYASVFAKDQLWTR
jgi:hypothetical protein